METQATGIECKARRDNEVKLGLNSSPLASSLHGKASYLNAWRDAGGIGNPLRSCLSCIDMRVRWWWWWRGGVCWWCWGVLVSLRSLWMTQSPGWPLGLCLISQACKHTNTDTRPRSRQQSYIRHKKTHLHLFASIFYYFPSNSLSNSWERTSGSHSSLKVVPFSLLLVSKKCVEWLVKDA